MADTCKQCGDALESGANQANEDYCEKCWGAGGLSKARAEEFQLVETCPNRLEEVPPEHQWCRSCGESLDKATPDAPRGRKRSSVARCLLLGLGCVGVLGACFVLWVIGNILYYPLISRLVTLDHRFHLESTSSDPALLGDTHIVLRRRLKKLGIPAQVDRSGSRFQIDVASGWLPGTPEELQELLCRSVRLRFQLLAQLTEEEREREIQRIRQAKAEGRYDPAVERFDLLKAHPKTRGLPSTEHVLVENGGILAKHFNEFCRAMDDRSRPCLGFELNPVGRKAMYRLTSQNVGRQLAIVLDGEVRTAPEIRGAIGKKGIIEGGDTGWNEEELGSLIQLLRGGALPVELRPVPRAE